MSYTEIVVGVDGSGPNRTALRWAAIQAARRDLPLRVVHAYHFHVPGRAFASRAALEHAAQHLAELTVEDAVAEVEATRPGLAVTGAAVRGHASAALMNAAHPAALVVLGSHGHNDLSAVLLGSVSLQLATYAPCPVAVVRGLVHNTTGPVMVGVDGSPAADEALDAAFEQAAIRRADLVVVQAFRPPEPSWMDSPVPLSHDPVAFEDELHEDLHRAVAPWRDKYPQVRVSCHTVDGRAGTVLAERSADAGLMVVGSRGRGGFAGLLLGSVSHHLINHSTCPVLVVRGSAHPSDS